ncbi:tetratricopeptide repeat protein [Methylobacterium fujisawaense]
MRIAQIAARYLYRRAERRRARGQVAAALHDLARAARAGYAPAQHALARAYQIGQGCPRSGAVAKRWYAAAAAAGYTDAQFELGLILLNKRDLDWMAGFSSAWLNHRADQEKSLVAALFPAGFESDGNPAEALAWLLRAAEADKAEAQANVGWLKLKGIGCERDRAEAHRWLSAAAVHDVSQAALGLAEYYGAADANERDLGQSALWAKKASELGNASGSHRYGLARRDGAGVERDSLEAERYFALAVEQGHPTAAYDGAVLALARNPSAGEFQALVERLRLCAKRSHIPSAMLLADLYGRGDRLQPDIREVAHWYRVAADLGDVQAQFMIGCLYARGEGLGLDLKHAARYFELAGNGGHSQAAFNLGVFSLNGQGIEQSVAEAKRWFSIAAKGGLVQAQLRLGQILEREAVTQVELASARMLIKRASDAGNGEAKIALAQMLLADGNPDSEQEALVILREAMNAGEIQACELLLRKEATGPDLEAVVQSLQRAARSGNSGAKFVLAEALLSDERVPRDAQTAIALLKEAAAAQEARAHFLLGIVYCQGVHVSKDLPRGYRHYLEAARLNHPLAQYNTGVMLLHGTGVDKSVEDAINWIRCAANNNLQKAVEFIRGVEQRALLADASN